MNSKGFTQNGCYGNQPQPFEALLYSIDADSSCSLPKQDLTVKEVYRVSFCFVLCNQPKFWHLTIILSGFYRRYLEIALFYTTPSRQIISCHVADVKTSLFFCLYHIDTFSLWISQVSGILQYLAKEKFWRDLEGCQCTKVNISEKKTLEV